MNYTNVYKTGAKLFDMWYSYYIWNHGKIKSNHITLFLLDLQRAWRLVPGLEYIKYNKYGHHPYITDEEEEMIYKYFHENPLQWAKYLQGL